MLSIYHIMLLAICFRGFQPGPSESVRTKSWRLYPLDHLFNADKSSLKEVYIPSLWWSIVFKDDFFGFRVELNLGENINTTLFIIISIVLGWGSQQFCF